jgi:hypothetical protein
MIVAVYTVALQKNAGGRDEALTSTLARTSDLHGWFHVAVASCQYRHARLDALE